MTEQLQPGGKVITLVHFLYWADGVQNTVMHRKRWHVACMPNMLDPRMQRTEEPRAVNCPQCKDTAEFKKAMALYE